jgi:hypothetical protein
MPMQSQVFLYLKFRIQENSYLLVVHLAVVDLKDQHNLCLVDMMVPLEHGILELSIALLTRLHIAENTMREF